jgi:hypothetical protein
MERSFVSLVTFVALVCFGCAKPQPGGIYYASGKGSVTPEGLHLLQWEPFRVTYVKPGADFRRYDKVLIQEVTIAYKTPPRRRPPTLSHRRPVVANYALPDSALESMKRYFREAFEASLRKSKEFTVVAERGPDVLLVAGHIVDLEVTVPPERTLSASNTYYSNSPGAMTLVLEAKDSQSGEPLVMVGERRDIDFNDGGIYQTDPVSSSAALQQIFQGWANDLRRELDQFRSLPVLPPAS